MSAHQVPAARVPTDLMRPFRAKLYLEALSYERWLNQQIRTYVESGSTTIAEQIAAYAAALPPASDATEDTP